MKITFATIIKLVTLTLLLALVAGCSGSSDAGKGGITAQLQWPLAKTTAKTVAMAPAGVATVRFVVSGPSMTTMQQDFLASAGSATMPGIPVGIGITFTAQGLDSNNNLIYQGSKFGLSVTAGQVTNAGTISMTSTSGAFASAVGDYPNNHNEKLSVDANGNVVGINLTSSATVFTGTLISTTDATVFGFAGKFVADGVTLSGTLNTTTGVFAGTTSTNASWTATKTVPVYSNATLSGVWISTQMGTKGSPMYFTFDGAGTISDVSAFNLSTPPGTYNVNKDSTYSITLQPANFTLTGGLSSATAGTIAYQTDSSTINKVPDLSKCQGSYSGTLSDGTTSYTVSFNVDATGTISSLSSSIPGVTTATNSKFFSLADGTAVFMLHTDATSVPYKQIKGVGTLVNGQFTGTMEVDSNTITGTVTMTKAVTLKSISVGKGALHSLFLKSDGSVWATGSNLWGILGDGTAADRNTPVRLTSLSNIVAVEAGTYSSYALDNKGNVWAWGTNRAGSLGNGTTSDSLVPIQVAGISNVIALSAGADTIAALKSDGTVWFWGYQSSGNILTPSQLSGVTNIVAIASTSGGSIAALRNDGTVWTFFYGASSLQVPNLSNIRAISSGFSQTFALKNDGTVWGWGYNNDGELGDGTTNYASVPVQVNNLNNITSISAGVWHAMAIKNDGSVYVWGQNTANGVFGNGTSDTSLIPVQVANLLGATYITAGNDSSFALKSDGTLWGWGGNSNGQLGDGSNLSRLMPVLIPTF